MKWQLPLVSIIMAVITCVTQAAPERPAATNEPPNTREEAADDAVGGVLLQAMSLLGVAYRFGGNSPESGLDCSGFIRYVFQKSIRVNLPRTAAEMAKLGRALSQEDLQPGDLVFFNTRGFTYSHAGIYLGNAQFIHAPRTGKNIEVSNMNQKYWQSRFNGGRRINRSTAYLAADTSGDVTGSVSRSSSNRAAVGENLTSTCRGRNCRAVTVVGKVSAKTEKPSKSSRSRKAAKAEKVDKSTKSAKSSKQEAASKATKSAKSSKKDSAAKKKKER